MIKDIEEGANLAVRLGKKLKPPEASDSNVMAWRWFVVVMITVDSVALALHVLLACGLTPMFSGFAYASDVKTNRALIETAREEQLSWRMFDLRIEQCAALKKGSGAQVYTIQLQELSKSFHDGSPNRGTPQIPECKELE